MALKDEDYIKSARLDGNKPMRIIGRHMVMIETYRYRADEEGNPIERPERFPRRFNSETELTREVKTGSQTFDFNLPSE